MSFDNYLLNLANISNEIGYSLTYGYGNIAATEINFLKTLIAKSEEMIPILEAEACFNEAEELDREERSFNNWMTMLYGKGDDFSPVETHSSEKANRLKRRKQNKKYHKADRYHGKCFEGRDEEGRRIYKDRYCRFPISDRVRNHSALKAEARKQEYLRTPSISEMKIEEEEKRITEEENRILDNHYAVEDMLSDLKEGKYIFLLSYWNGMGWECSDDATNEFRGILTSEKVKDGILSEQARHLNLVKTEKETVHGMSGISFTWKGYYDLEDECGYTKFTFLPIN